MQLNMNHFSNGDLNDSTTIVDEGKPGEVIKIGRDYQAVVPPFQTISDAERSRLDEKALLVWSPTADISNATLDEYVHLAKEMYGYSGEQALGMLYWHKYDMQRAMSDLANFTPYPENWTTEDKVIFEQSFLFNGKNFHKIRQNLPDKTIAMLVKYYYSWKKLKGRVSLMDRQVKRSAQNNSSTAADDLAATSDNGTEAGSITDSDSEDKKWVVHRGIQRETESPPKESENVIPGNNNVKQEGEKKKCSNCSVLCTYIHTTGKGSMCRTCMLHYRKTGNARPTFGRMKGRSDRYSMFEKKKRTLPRGMYMNHDDLLAIATASESQESDELFLRTMERELSTLKRNMQNNRQRISGMKRKIAAGIDDYRLPESNALNRINSRWTNDELLLAVQGVRKFGRDFHSIAEVLGNKTEAHIKTFYANYRRRYNLDGLLREYEAENGHSVKRESNTDSEDVLFDNESVNNSQSPPASPVQINNNKAQTVVAK